MLLYVISLFPHMFPCLLNLIYAVSQFTLHTILHSFRLSRHFLIKDLELILKVVDPVRNGESSSKKCMTVQ